MFDRFDIGILSKIGRTPLIELTNVFPQKEFRLYAKLEMLNPGGSIKDRPALGMIESAIAEGLIKQNTTIIESSSGNLGIGLAQVCAVLKIKLICVVDPLSSEENLGILRAYGANLVMVSETVDGKYLPARVAKVKSLLKEIPDSYWCNQYSNSNNPLSLRKMMKEIADELGNKTDYLFCAVSTCGTLRGCREQIEIENMQTKIIAIDAQGSSIFGDGITKRMIPGHGAGMIPELYRPNLEDMHMLVSDIDCIAGCRLLVKEEGLLAGGSSGGIITAIGRMIHVIPSGSVCVAILPDRGERYLHTIYSDQWIAANFGSEADSKNDVRPLEGTKP